MNERLSRRATGRFFVRIGQVGRATEERDPYTRPLFSLPMIMDAEGTLSKDARHLARGTDPETSRAAAARAGEFRGRHEAAIGPVIEVAGERGATSKEIAAALANTKTPLTHIQVDRRLGAMGERGLIERHLRKDPQSETDFERRGGCAIWWKTGRGKGMPT